MDMCVWLPTRSGRFTARKERQFSTVTPEFVVFGGVLYYGSGLNLLCLVGCIYVYQWNLTHKRVSQSVRY